MLYILMLVGILQAFSDNLTATALRINLANLKELAETMEISIREV